MDYKIISKVITLRLSRVLHRIIEPDQTCSIPGRSIFSNVYLIRDVLDYIEQTDEAAILVSLILLEVLINLNLNLNLN